MKQSKGHPQYFLVFTEFNYFIFISDEFLLAEEEIGSGGSVEEELGSGNKSCNIILDHFLLCFDNSDLLSIVESYAPP